MLILCYNTYVREDDYMLTRKQKRLISLGAIFIVAVLSVVVTYTVMHIDLLPAKYLLLFVAIMLTLNILSAVCLLVKKVWTRIIAVIIHILLIVISIVGINYVGKADNFLDDAFENYTYDITKFNIVVNATSNYKTLQDLSGKDISYFNFYEDIEQIKSEVSKKIENPIFKEQIDLFVTADYLLKDEISALVIDDGFLGALDENYNDIDKRVRIIDTFEIKTKVKKDNNSSNPTTAPVDPNASTTTTEKLEKIKSGNSINVFISGSDARSTTIQGNSRSDVNMILTINPDTRTILMTSIPRDYEVLPHGKTGLTGKLSHVGIYGLETTKKTVEDLMGIEINYAIKVGFSAVVELVDLVGGIDINSDQAFDSSHIRGWHVEKGINHMDGAKALAYARERYAYSSGDRHRVLNQQQVLQATLKKLMKSSSLLTQYDQVLSSLSQFYITDIPRSVISKYVKMQLNNMSSWKFTSQSVNGGRKYAKTFSAPNTDLFIATPDYNSIKKARNKIQKTIEG